MPKLNVSEIAAETFGNTTAILRSVGVYVLVFVLAVVVAVRFGGQLGLWGTMVGAIAILAAASALGAAIYRRLLSFRSGATILSGTRQLFLVSTLVWIAISIVAFIAGLTLVLMSGVLVVASGYDPSGGEASDVSGSLEALQASGAVWILYAAIGGSFAVLVWFLTRLCLAGAATITSGKVKVFQTWGVTKDVARPILLLLAMFICGPMAVVWAILGLVSAAIGPLGVVILGAFLVGLILVVFHVLSASLFKRLNEQAS